MMNKRTNDRGTDPIDFENPCEDYRRTFETEQNDNDVHKDSCHIDDSEPKESVCEVNNSLEDISKTEQESTVPPSHVDNFRFLDTIVPDR